MKKIFFLIFITVFSLQIFAQQNPDHIGFKKGDKYLSGLAGYSSVVHPDQSKVRNVEVSPRFGYFINDFIAIGGRLGYNYHLGKNSNGDRTLENSTFTAEVFGRYYLLPGSRFSLFGELGLGFGSTKNIAGKWTNGINGKFAPGLSYFINQNFALETTIGVISYQTVKPDGSSGSTDSFEVGMNLEKINFGIIFKF